MEKIMNLIGPNDKYRRLLFVLAILALTALSACKTDAKATTPTQPPPPPKPTNVPSAEAGPSEPTVAPPEDVEPTPAPAAQGLPAEPQRVEFQAEDGKKLVGHYYPGRQDPSPTVILMHWARGDQRNWLAIAPWLQNRPDELAALTGWADAIGTDCDAQITGPWLDPSWFPPMPPDISFGVFTFDFRDFCESEVGLSDPSEWALDALAAFNTVRSLPGVDPHQIVAIGASIGADGSPDSCMIRYMEGETCLGALSLSPGNYLFGEHFMRDYASVVAELDGAAPPVPVWCLTAEGDRPSFEACSSATVDTKYRSIYYDGNAHGMMLLTSEYDPNPMILIQDFLEEVFGVEIN
jgi:dienelactone hydrolase